MRHTLRSLLLSLSGLLLLASCGQSAPEEPRTQYRTDNEKFVEETAANPEYTKLTFENSSQAIYYKVLRALPEGQEPLRPLQNSRVQYRYTLRLISGEIKEEAQTADSRIFLLDGQRNESLIRGMQLALQYMAVGEQWEVVIPWQMGYGAYSTTAIPAYSTLIFDVELLDILEL